MAEGMSAEEARYAARRQFGNQTLLREQSREIWGVGLIETLFQDLRFCGYTGWDGSFTLTGRAEAERIEGARVTANFFSVLGVAPILGRAFLPEEDRPQAEGTVILSYGLWRRRFDADPNIVGQSLTLDGKGYTAPGVVGVASVNWLPLHGGPADLLRVEGQPPPPPGEVPKTTTHVVSSDYFRTMGITLLKGRSFTEDDNQSAPKALIINSALAKKLFGQEDPIGRRIIFEGAEPKPVEVVGVVDDERVGELDEEAVAVAYRPYLQEPWTKLNLVVRTAGDSGNVVNAVRGEVRALDPNLALYSVATMGQLIAEQPATFLRRYPALLLGLFAVLALILAAVGVYGVISYSVSERTKEIGIRMALGAERRDVLKLIVGQGMALTLCGVSGGLITALALTRLMRSLLFEVNASDPLTFITVSALIAVAALLACWIPARRATKVDPTVALRCE